MDKESLARKVASDVLPNRLWRSVSMIVSGPASDVFRVVAADGYQVVVKVANESEGQVTAEPELFLRDEALTYRVLDDLVVPVPHPRLFGADPRKRWIAVEAIAGRPFSEVRGGLDRKARVAACATLGGALAKIHSLRVDDRLAPAGRPTNDADWRSSFRSLLDNAISELEARAPANQRFWRNCREYSATLSSVTESPWGHCVIHGDYRGKNILVDKALRIVGIIDWEWTTVADPMLEVVKIDFESRAAGADGIYTNAQEGDAFWAAYAHEGAMISTPPEVTATLPTVPITSSLPCFSLLGAYQAAETYHRWWPPPTGSSSV